MVLKVRETLVNQHTQLVNALRGHAAEFGIIAAKRTSQVTPLLAAIGVETAIPPEAKEMLAFGDGLDQAVVSSAAVSPVAEYVLRRFLGRVRWTGSHHD
jgi:transposase